ncbi:hypothetical protein SGLAM104S_04454 [Streptomyces glaucescens]
MLALAAPGGAGPARAPAALSNEQYNQAFTLHGTIMLLLFATPDSFAGFANADHAACRSAPPDVAFPA